MNMECENHNCMHCLDSGEQYYCNLGIENESVGPDNCDEYCDFTKEDLENDLVWHPSHYAGQIECIDYIRDKLSPDGFTDYCIGNVLKYVSRWRKKDGLQDLKKAVVYLNWAVENVETRS